MCVLARSLSFHNSSSSRWKIRSAVNSLEYVDGVCGWRVCLCDCVYLWAPCQNFTEEREVVCDSSDSSRGRVLFFQLQSGYCRSLLTVGSSAGIKIWEDIWLCCTTILYISCDGGNVWIALQAGSLQTHTNMEESERDREQGNSEQEPAKTTWGACTWEGLHGSGLDLKLWHGPENRTL